MPRPFALTRAERETLEQRRDHGPTPSLRERAAARLKVDDGMPPARVAREGLRRPRNPATIYAWRDRFSQPGLAGLDMRRGRGRKPACSPVASLASGRR